MSDFDLLWNADIRKQLQITCNSKEDSNVTIWVGKDRRIAAHKFVLDASSKFMEVECSTYNETNRMYDVILGPEFSDNPDLVDAAISSFYTGIIAIDNVDVAKLVYKFAKVYSVRWLAERTLQELKKFLNEENFVELFEFSHSIWCDKLKDMCLEYMTPAIAQDIIASGKLNNANYFCMKTLVTVNDTMKLKPLQKFRLIAQWFEFDVLNRSCHIESLLSEVQYNLIGLSDTVHIVQTWVMDNDFIQDDIKWRTMKKINRSLKTLTPSSPAPAQVDKIQSSASESRPFMLITNIEELFAKLVCIIKNNTAFEGEHLSNDEAIAVVYYKWNDLNALQRQMVMEYLYLLPGLICKENITDLFLLYDIGFKMKKLLNLRFDSFRNAAKHVDCGIISFGMLQMFYADFCNIIDAKSNNHLIYVIQLIINWAISHPAQFSKANEIFKQLCTCNLPYFYIKLVLFPYLRNLSTDDVNVCGKHGLKLDDIKDNGRPVCKTVGLTSKMYMLQDDKISTFLDSYEVCFERNQQFPLCFYFFYNNGNPSKKIRNFILFDKDVCMKEFPCYIEQDLSIDELRELIAEYSNLHLMFDKLR